MLQFSGCVAAGVLVGVWFSGCFGRLGLVLGWFGCACFVGCYDVSYVWLS